MAGIKIELKGETLTYAGEQFHTSPEEAKETLEKYGIAIIPNRLTQEECKQMNEGMWKTAEYLTSKMDKPLNRSDPSTYDSVAKLEAGKDRGLIQNWGWGHAQYTWDVRSNPKISEVFEEVFQTNDLLVSFDGVNCNLGMIQPLETYTIAGHVVNNSYIGKHNLHCDQRFNMNSFECVQTWLNANPTDVGDGTLRILQGSHLLHGEFRKAFEGKITNPDEDWHVLTEEQIQWYKDHGCQDMCIVCPAGSQVCWDSRTIHCGMAPLRTKDMPSEFQKTDRNFRNVMYICMVPSSYAGPENLQVRKEIFQPGELRLRSAIHWPQYMKLFPSQSFLINLPELKSELEKIPEIPMPVLNSKGKQLAGLNKVVSEGLVNAEPFSLEPNDPKH